MKSIASYVVAFAFSLVLIVGFISLYFWFEIPRTPRAPDPENGFVFPYNNHGVTHYVTWFDHALSNAASIIILFAVPVVIVAALWTRVTKK